MRVRYVVMSCLLALIVSFGSDTARAAAGWTNPGAITEISQQPANTGGLVFVSTSVTVNPGACSSSAGLYFPINDERQKRLFAMLLAAQASSRLVKIYTTGICHVWGVADLDGVTIN